MDCLLSVCTFRVPKVLNSPLISEEVHKLSLNSINHGKLLEYLQESLKSPQIFLEFRCVEMKLRRRDRTNLGIIIFLNYVNHVHIHVHVTWIFGPHSCYILWRCFWCCWKLFFLLIMPENVWPLINIANYIFFKKRPWKTCLVLLKDLKNVIFWGRTLYLTLLLLDLMTTTPDKWIWLTINNCLTVTIHGSKRTNDISGLYSQ